MKMHPLLALILPLLLCSLTTRAQWAAQADSIFGPYSTLTDLDAVDGQVAWAGGGSSLLDTTPTHRPWVLRTTNAGQDWYYDSIAGTAGYTLLSLSATGANQCWASLYWPGAPEKSRIYRTNNAGATWEKVLERVTAGGFVHFFDAQQGVAVRGNRYTFTNNSGNTWSPDVQLPIPDSLQYPLYPVLSRSYTTFGDTIWYLPPLSKVVRSTDRGHTWTVLDVPVLGDSVALDQIAFSTASNGLATAGTYLFPPQIFATSDGGQTWQATPSPEPISLGNATLEAISAIPGQPGWFVLQCSDFVQNSSLTYLSKDFGATWVVYDASEALLYAGFLFDFTVEKTGWVGLTYFNVEGPCVFHWESPLEKPIRSAPAFSAATPVIRQRPAARPHVPVAQPATRALGQAAH